MTVCFSTNQAAALATFLAQLHREGCSYTVKDIAGGWRVAVTGH